MEIRSVLVSHPRRIYTLSSLGIALFALSPTPSFLPIVVLIATLKLATSTFLHRHDGYLQGFVQVIALSISASLASLAPALQALSAPTTSLLVLATCSSIFSAVAIAVVISAQYASRLSKNSWTKLVLFPALWATTWGFVSQVSPVGQLATWSPVTGIGPYVWFRPFLGEWGINWCAAAWATLISEAVGIWVVGEYDPFSYEALPDGGNPRTTSSATSSQRARWSLAALLLALMVPSSFLTHSALPPNALQSSPIGVSCILPVVSHTRKRAHLPTLDDYIAGIKVMQGTSTIMLWPESAVRFDSSEEKKDAFQKIQEILPNKKYVGVSFEEYTPPELEGGVLHPEKRRNGFALLGPTGPPVLEYYKRKLVPIAESFSLTPGTEDPGMFTLQLGNPKPWSPSDWAPGPNHTRPIPVTASICLDFSSPASFQHLTERPSLILAPARTWHIGIAKAMWEQAKARAEETGSIVLWCDGGEGGVSGVAGRGYHEYMQVGQGTWSRTIGVPWPTEEQPTVFLWGGKYMALAIIWSTLGAGWTMRLVVDRIMKRSLARPFFPMIRFPSTFMSLPATLIAAALSWRAKRVEDAEQTRAASETTPLIDSSAE